MLDVTGRSCLTPGALSYFKVQIQIASHLQFAQNFTLHAFHKLTL
jgi:hypothetical protein